MQADPNNLPAILTVEEAAAFLRIGRSAAYIAVRRGLIPSVKVGRLYRIPRGVLMEWLGQKDASKAFSQGQPAANETKEDQQADSHKLLTRLPMR